MTGHGFRGVARAATVALLVLVSGAVVAADLPERAPAAAGSRRTVAVEEPAQTGTVVEQATDPATAEPEPAEPGPAAAPPSADPPRVPEFLRRSGSRAGGPANELNTGDARATDRPPGGSVSRMLAGRDLYHGNYCGPGDRGPGVEPTDALDAICQRHDACYTATGHRSCGCDRELRKSALSAAADSSLSRVVRARAASVAESIAFMNCAEP